MPRLYKTLSALEMDRPTVRTNIAHDIVGMGKAGVSKDLRDRLSAGASNPGAGILEDLQVIHSLWEAYGR